MTFDLPSLAIPVFPINFALIDFSIYLGIGLDVTLSGVLYGSVVLNFDYSIHGTVTSGIKYSSSNNLGLVPFYYNSGWLATTNQPTSFSVAISSASFNIVVKPKVFVRFNHFGEVDLYVPAIFTLAATAGSYYCEKLSIDLNAGLLIVYDVTLTASLAGYTIASYQVASNTKDFGTFYYGPILSDTICFSNANTYNAGYLGNSLTYLTGGIVYNLSLIHI